MKKLLRNFLLLGVITLMFPSFAESTKSDSVLGVEKDKIPLTSAIFVRNNGGRELVNYTTSFSDMLSSKLSDKGFSVMSWNDIIQKFRESPYPEDQILSNVKAFMASETATKSNAEAMVTGVSEKQSNETQLISQTKEGALAGGSSLRISQMMSANYIIVASMGRVSHERRVFRGENTIYKTNNTADIYTLPLTLRILNGNTGATVYGNSIEAVYKILQNENLTVSLSDIPQKLIEAGSTDLADAIASEVDKIQKIQLANLPVEFSIESNVDGVTAELDGAALGTCPGKFYARPGIHQLRLSRQYFQTWEKSVNIYQNQKLNIALELSTDGLAKYKDIAAFKQSQELEKLKTLAKIDIEKEQSKANADVKEKISSGKEVFYKNSYIRSDGFAQQLEQIIHGN